MTRRDKVFYTKLLLLFLGIVSLLSFFYTLKLREVIERNILFNVTEVAQHDKRALRASIELFLDELSGVEKRLAVQGAASIRDLEAQLNLEGATTAFTRLFMLAEDGRIFTDRFLIYDRAKEGTGARFDFLQLLEGSDRRELVLRFDDNDELAGIARESILYAIRLEDFSVDGLRMTALMGCTDITFLQQHLIIDGFVKNGKSFGFSSVIDLNGNYIVGRTRDIYLRNDTNFFTELAAGQGSLSKRDIVARMARREEFSLYLEDGEGRKLVYFVPFGGKEGPKLDWYFIMVVDNGMLVERQATFTLMGLSLLGLVVLALTLLLLYGIASRKKLHQAHESVRVRSEFLSSMSHEIRTPLNGIIGLNHLIAAHVENPGRLSQVRDWLNKSRSLADYLISLLNDVLDMSKLQAGKVEIAHNRYSITAMIADVVFMQAAHAEKRGLRLTLEEAVPDPWVMGDETRVKQVLVNIIGNAVKFTPGGGSVTVSVRQERVARRHVRTFYRCRDTGRGMSKAFLQKLFDPFTQDPRAQKDAALKGSGLGMPIAKELVLAMGGSIEVDSEEGAGSTFTVTIPSEIAARPALREEEPAAAPRPAAKAGRDAAKPGAPRAQAPVAAADAAPATPSTASPQAPATPAAPEPPRKGRILLAEDAEFNAEFLMEVLADAGFSVVHAKNGEEAVEIFRASAEDEFAVILMDMQMPVMDGCEATAAIRALKRPDAETVTIYACTANSFKEDMDKAMASGMDDFLTKPIDIKVFLQKMAAINCAPAGPAAKGRP
ncbi:MULTISPECIES: ATP-binding protein [unclassified Desulfovibrio]|uniref:hybrid sensor histidine kinase/response regulator n=1 Tax=unclassified Desulfovibrio TaxID=2593640 RepID=UPI0013E9D8E6|nr:MULTISPECIES: ATP-binding protein [unclassified Desulfovibrio]